MFSIEVFPPPLVPKIQTNSFCYIFKSTPLRAATPSIPSKYVLCIFLRTIISFYGVKS